MFEHVLKCFWNCLSAFFSHLTSLNVKLIKLILNICTHSKQNTSLNTSNFRRVSLNVLLCLMLLPGSVPVLCFLTLFPFCVVHFRTFLGPSMCSLVCLLARFNLVLPCNVHSVPWSIFQHRPLLILVIFNSFSGNYILNFLVPWSRSGLKQLPV